MIQQYLTVGLSLKEQDHIARKYQRRIRQFAETDLKERLESAIAPIMHTLPPEVISTMVDEISRSPLPDEEGFGPRDRMGSR